MEELFNILSSSARLDKSKRKTDKQPRTPAPARPDRDDEHHDEHGTDHGHVDKDDAVTKVSRDRTGKRDSSEDKRRQVHREETAAFRRSMSIRVASKHDPHLPDPIAAFADIRVPSWWSKPDSFRSICRAIQRNIEHGKWKEPTPVQMQSIPNLLERRDMIGAAPTGSGKSGAFIVPALVLSSAPHQLYYNVADINNLASSSNSSGTSDQAQQTKKRKHSSTSQKLDKAKSTREGEIRSLILAPARELATQLHREVERLGLGKPGGLSAQLLSKANAAHIIAGRAGGKNGIDVLVATPLRLVDAIEKGLRLDSTRLVVLDEADRLLDASDGQTEKPMKQSQFTDRRTADDTDEESDTDSAPKHRHDHRLPSKHVSHASGSSQSQTFLSQMDVILNAVPATAVRALFSATVTATVRSLAESILRNPVDMTIAAPGSYGGANTDIDQKLMFVGREDGKLLAIRQIVQRGELKPPAIVFVQSKERAQALFSELLYDGIHVDVIHAGRSKTARDDAVARFRKGETWVLICTDLVARGVDFRAVNMVINYDLPTSGVTYVHRIGRTGRAGRSGHAVTFFTEADFDNLRTIANVMKQSGCKVDDWMLQLRKSGRPGRAPIRRRAIDTSSGYDKKKRRRKMNMIQQNKKSKSFQRSNSG